MLKRLLKPKQLSWLKTNLPSWRRQWTNLTRIEPKILELNFSPKLSLQLHHISLSTKLLRLRKRMAEKDVESAVASQIISKREIYGLQYHGRYILRTLHGRMKISIYSKTEKGTKLRSYEVRNHPILKTIIWSCTKFPEHTSEWVGHFCSDCRFFLQKKVKSRNNLLSFIFWKTSDFFQYRISSLIAKMCFCVNVSFERQADERLQASKFYHQEILISPRHFWGHQHSSLPFPIPN